MTTRENPAQKVPESLMQGKAGSDKELRTETQGKESSDPGHFDYTYPGLTFEHAARRNRSSLSFRSHRDSL